MKRSFCNIAKRFALRTLKQKRGVALIASMMIMASLTLLGLWGVTSSLIDNMITINYRSNTESFYAAEAGIERAREYLRGLDFKTELIKAAGSDNQLVNSKDINSFPGDDIPIYSNVTIGNSSYTVYITNDADDGVTNVNDTNDRITITSFGYGPSSSLSVVQGIIKKPEISFSSPAPIVLLGPGVQQFEPGNSNSFFINGNDTAGGESVPAIIVSNEQAKQTVENGCEPRCDQIQGAGQVIPSVAADPGAISQAGLDSIENLRNILKIMKAHADFTSTSDPGFHLGTEDNPSVVFIDGSFDSISVDSKSGHGILVVTDTLTFRGDFTYNGVILVVGRGNFIRYGAGTGTINGSIIVADIDGLDGIPLNADDAFEPARFFTAGGGDSKINYNSDLINNPLKNDAPWLLALTQKY